LFIERGLNLLAPCGAIAYIVPNKLIGAPYAKTIRQILAENSIHEVRDYSRVPVFAEAAVYPVTFVAQRATPRDDVAMVVMKNVLEPGSCNIVPKDTFYRETEWSRFFASNSAQRILAKCASHRRLGEFFPEITGAATVSEAYQLAEVVGEWRKQEARRFKKLVNTGTVDPYCILWGARPTRYIKHSYTKPIVLDSDISKMSHRRYRQACANKIIIGGMTLSLESAYDEGECLAGKSTTVILEGGPLSLKYALGLLNSRLITFWYRQQFKALTLAGGYLRINSNEVRQIPVATASDPHTKQIIDLVERILSAKREAADAPTRTLQEEIDQRVYSLYGLTDEEIAIVEEQRDTA
jgi:hypothetical protein